MASRPSTTGEPLRATSTTPAWSDGQSNGIESIARTAYDPSIFAGEMAEDFASNIVDNALDAEPVRHENTKALSGVDENDKEQLLLTIDQLNAELANARSEVEFANLKEEELDKRRQIAEEALDRIQEQNQVLNDLVKAEQENEASSRHRAEQLENQNRDLRYANDDLAAKQATSRDLQPDMSAANQELSQKNADLSSQVKALRAELQEAQDGAEAEKAEKLQAQSSLLKSQEELTSGESQESAALAAAYKQIQKLNTEMTHIYAELTLLRTEAQKAGGGADAEASRSAEAQRVETDERQTAQIGDLVADIRHLQLDLEYHQQKLDQMIAEKQQMMGDMKKSQEQLAEANQQLEEKEQVLRHTIVDLERAQKDKTSTKAETSRDGDAAAALRAEAAAKDSALIVSHYELQKERLLRERLEQKNLKLVERMQKLMMVVETMRREHVGLERALQGQESRCEEQDRKLRDIRKKQKEQKAQAAKSAGGKTPRSGKTPQDNTLPELSLSDGPGAYPSMATSQRSIDSAAGRRTGTSTPRGGPRVPPSPYGGSRRGGEL